MASVQDRKSKKRKRDDVANSEATAEIGPGVGREKKGTIDDSSSVKCKKESTKVRAKEEDNTSTLIKEHGHKKSGKRDDEAAAESDEKIKKKKRKEERKEKEKEKKEKKEMEGKRLKEKRKEKEKEKEKKEKKEMEGKRLKEEKKVERRDKKKRKEEEDKSESKRAKTEQRDRKTTEVDKTPKRGGGEERIEKKQLEERGQGRIIPPHTPQTPAGVKVGQIDHNSTVAMPPVNTSWAVAQLEGGQARQSKFLRLLGAKSADATNYFAPSETSAIKKREEGLEHQYNVGMMMKMEPGLKRKGLGA